MHELPFCCAHSFSETRGHSFSPTAEKQVGQSGTARQLHFLDSTWAEALNVFACVFADGGLCGRFRSSRPGRLPICSRLIWKCCNRGCSLHARWHGHRNCKYVFLIPTHQSISTRSHKRFVLQTYSSWHIYFTILLVSLCLHRAPSAACVKSGAIYLAIPTPGGRMPSLQFGAASLVAHVYPLCPCLCTLPLRQIVTMLCYVHRV